MNVDTKERRKRLDEIFDRLEIAENERAVCDAKFAELDSEIVALKREASELLALDEKKPVTRKCGKCGQQGHSKRTCPN